MPYEFFAEPPESHAVENLKLIYKSFLDPSDLEHAIPSLIGTTPDKVKSVLKLPSDYFVLVPANSHLDKGSSINHRAWPIEHWQELMHLMSEEGLNGVIIGGKGETSFFNQFEDYPSNIISLVGQTNFPQLIGLIQGAQGVITTDTGPSHIAAAVNTTVYALIGPTNYKRTGPYKTKYNQVHILTVNLPCSPCYHTERINNCNKNECMLRITPAKVMNSITNNKRI
jgi:ADP-heptose:LPS heptosyltransferase